MNNHCEDPDTGDTIYYTSDSWVNANEAPVKMNLLPTPSPEALGLYTEDAEKSEEEIPAWGAKNAGRDDHEFVTLGFGEKVDPAEIAEELSRGLRYASGRYNYPPRATDVETTEPDMVNNPPHYGEGRKHKPKDVIRDWGLNFNLGSATKYIARAGRKGDAIEDIDKAIAYLGFEREALLAEREES